MLKVNIKIPMLPLLLSCVLFITSSCSSKKGDSAIPITTDTTVNKGKSDIAVWLTTPDKTVLLQKLTTTLNFSKTNNTNTTINVDTTRTYQTMDGFGFALTGGSATLLNGLGSNQAAVLNELFGTGTGQIGISYLRVSIGASDLSANDFTYDETPGDVKLDKFSINAENTDLIPVLKKILAINPNIKIMASPWTAPTWMKVNTLGNNGFTGGSLNTIYYDAYARYFVKYILAMRDQGITIDAITPQNEPQNPYNNPSMLMRADEQINFIKNNLAPNFQTAGLKTKIICFDHNADHTNYADSVLRDPGANLVVDGSAFHLYAGSISSLSPLRNSFPAKNIYFTEQYTAYPGNFAGDLQWAINNLIVGAPQNWSRNVLEWGLATDASQGPHTNGGCSTCLGGITINGSNITRNVGYYIIAQASKFVRPGATRIGSDNSSTLANVAFKNPDGSKVLIVINNSTSTQSFNIKFGDRIAATNLPAGAVASYVW